MGGCCGGAARGTAGRAWGTAEEGSVAAAGNVAGAEMERAGGACLLGRRATGAAAGAGVGAGKAAATEGAGKEEAGARVAAAAREKALAASG